MNVSNDIKNAYKSGSHQKTLNISFPDIPYTVPADEIYFESMILDESIFDGDSFEVVGCISSKFEIQIRDSKLELKGQKIVVTISIDIGNNSVGTIPLFIGYVDTVEREAQKKLQKITAYDALYSKGNTDVAEWYNNLTFPITMHNFINSLFSYIGIELDNSLIPGVSLALPTDGLTINREYNPNTLSAISVIKAICQINCRFGIINRYGRFEFRPANNASIATEEVSFYRTMDYKDYVINPVDVLVIRQNTDDPGVTIRQTTPTTNESTYIIQGNMFTYNLDTNTLRMIGNSILNDIPSVLNLSYIPFEASNNGYPWVECGESLEYNVYDFDASEQQQQDIYKPVTVTVFKRTLKGIQNILDVYNSRGEEYQREFVSDVSTELNVLQQTVDNLIKNMSTEITIYRNPDTIVADENTPVTIADLTYEANEGNTILFHEEAILNVIAKEEFVDGAYVEHDVSGIVRYYVNGVRIANHVSETVLTEGKHLLNLMQFWQAGESQSNRVQAKLEVINGYATIQKLDAKAYITVKQSNYVNAGLEVKPEPTKLVYRPGEQLDFSGMVVSKVYFDDTTPSEDVTNECDYTPPEGTVVSTEDSIEVKVIYTEETEVGDIKTYNTSFFLSTNYLISIHVEEEPNKTNYFIGETFNIAGLKVVADYADGTVKDVTSYCTCVPDNGYQFVSEDEGNIHITYTEDGITKETNTFVSVQKVVAESLMFDLHKVDTNYFYNIGETLDYMTGLKVYCKYNNGNIEEVTDQCEYYPPNGEEVLDTTPDYVTVSYDYGDDYITDGFDLTIKPIEFDLRYFEYYQFDGERVIAITGLNTDVITQEGVGEIAIPETIVHPETGLVYSIDLSREF